MMVLEPDQIEEPTNETESACELVEALRQEEAMQRAALAELEAYRGPVVLAARLSPEGKAALAAHEDHISKLRLAIEQTVVAIAAAKKLAVIEKEERRAALEQEAREMLADLDRRRDALIEELQCQPNPQPDDCDRAYAIARQAYSLAHDLYGVLGDQSLHRRWDVAVRLGEKLLPKTGTIHRTPFEKKLPVETPWKLLIGELRELTAPVARGVRDADPEMLRSRFGARS